MAIEYLQDSKNGKSAPWIPKKVRSLKVADSFKRLGHDQRSSRIRFCGSSLQFLKNLETGQKRLFAADFCKERMCPMCQWRKSLKVFHQVSQVMDRIQVDHKNLVPIFLTLTVRNCPSDILRCEVENVLKGWYQLTKHYTFKKRVVGWFRALEVTHNDGSKSGLGILDPNYDSFHPHIHAIILVDKSYFKSDDYLDTKDWVRLWRTACSLDYDPVCDIRKVRDNAGKYKAVAEVAKYTLKDGDFIKSDDTLTDKLIETFFYSLSGRRLHAFGGIMKKVAKLLLLDDIESGDLVNVSGDEIREDVASVIEVYRWNFGMANYIRGDDLPFKQKEF
jgi:plasmid rolling circle replication initiator protein Rep